MQSWESGCVPLILRRRVDGENIISTLQTVSDPGLILTGSGSDPTEKTGSSFEFFKVQAKAEQIERRAVNICIIIIVN